MPQLRGPAGIYREGRRRRP